MNWHLTPGGGEKNNDTSLLDVTAPENQKSSSELDSNLKSTVTAMIFPSFKLLSKMYK